MEKIAIRNQIIEIVARVKRVKPAALDIADDQDFISSLAIDSLDAVNLTIELSQTFGFTFGEELEDIEALASFGRLVNLVHQRAPCAA